MIKAILTDIEGTITRISFVKEVLFPYAATQLPAFIRNNADKSEVATQINAVKDIINEPDADIDVIINTLLTWIAEDKKIPPLKQLQGLIWQTGYEQGDFKGHLYPDAFDFIQRQYAQGTALYVYSSGSVKAQHLLFKYSDYGDIRGLFTGFFDTNVGAKQELKAYKTIVDQLPFHSENMLFLSDVASELDAAKAAGLKTLHLIRDGQSTTKMHPYINNFSQFELEQYQ
jgi:enolase-phosphatase E1